MVRCARVPAMKFHQLMVRCAREPAMKFHLQFHLVLRGHPLFSPVTLRKRRVLWRGLASARLGDVVVR